MDVFWDRNHMNREDRLEQFEGLKQRYGSFMEAVIWKLTGNEDGQRSDVRASTVKDLTSKPDGGRIRWERGSTSQSGGWKDVDVLRLDIRDIKGISKESF